MKSANVLRTGLARIGAAAAMSAVIAMASAAGAQVTGTTSPMFVKSGKTGLTYLRLESPNPVDAINCELTFDSALLTNPRVESWFGAPGFTLAQNVLSAGVFRFVLYRNPATQSLDLIHPVVAVVFDAVPGQQNSTQTQVNYTIAAAARLDPQDPTRAVSVAIGDSSDNNPPAAAVTFPAFTVFIGGNEAQDWALYE